MREVESNNLAMKHDLTKYETLGVASLQTRIITQSL